MNLETWSYLEIPPTKHAAVLQTSPDNKYGPEEVQQRKMLKTKAYLIANYSVSFR